MKSFPSFHLTLHFPRSKNYFPRMRIIDHAKEGGAAAAAEIERLVAEDRVDVDSLHIMGRRGKAELAELLLIVGSSSFGSCCL